MRASGAYSPIPVRISLSTRARLASDTNTLGHTCSSRSLLARARGRASTSVCSSAKAFGERWTSSPPRNNRVEDGVILAKERGRTRPLRRLDDDSESTKNLRRIPRRIRPGPGRRVAAAGHSSRSQDAARSQLVERDLNSASAKETNKTPAPPRANSASVHGRPRMMTKHFVTLIGTAGTVAIVVLGTSRLRSVSAQSMDGDREESRIQQGFAMNPVPLDLARKNHALVGSGSYIVNGAANCDGCHNPGPGNNSWLPGGDPFFGEPAVVNPVGYMGGGRDFQTLGVTHIITRNITPDRNGLPAGRTFEDFRLIMRTG